jgi:hypothetical protein
MQISVLYREDIARLRGVQKKEFPGGYSGLDLPSLDSNNSDMRYSGIHPSQDYLKRRLSSHVLMGCVISYAFFKGRRRYQGTDFYP